MRVKSRRTHCREKGVPFDVMNVARVVRVVVVGRPGSLTGPIDVQLRRSGGAALCWGARLSASFARNERGLLKDKSDGRAQLSCRW
jgi:hypothetical protein